MASIELDDLTKLIADIEALGVDIEDSMAKYVEEAMDALVNSLPAYPSPPGPDAPSPLQTDRQRRWFWAALRDGRIDVPYNRRGSSGGLAGSWETEVESVVGEVTGVMGNTQPYAPYVIGIVHQAPIHDGRWWILEEEFERFVPKAIDIIIDGAYEVLAEAIG